MATPPHGNAAPRASSILSQATTAAVAVKPTMVGAPTSVTTKAWVLLRRVFFNAEDVADPKRLYDILNRIQENLLAVLGVVSTNQIVPGNILRNVKFSAFVPINLAHGLGRKYQGYFVVRAYNAPTTFPMINDLLLIPSTLDASKVVVLLSNQDFTCDLYVF